MDLDVGIIDAQVNVYNGDEVDDVELPLPRALVRDPESIRAWPSLDVISYMFGNAGARAKDAVDLDAVLKLLDEWGIQRAQVPVYPLSSKDYLDRLSAHSDRIFGTLRLDPHDGYECVRALDELAGSYQWIRSVSMTPATTYPQIPPNSKEYYPIYSKCIELDIPVMLNVGFPGPRIPGMVQDPMLIEEVAWFYPELRIVMKHGGEPWSEVCTRLVRKWPNLYFSTTGFAPRRYPPSIVSYLQGSGSHKIIYGGYFPSIGLDRIMSELQEIELDRERAERFLRLNAIKVFKLDAG